MYIALGVGYRKGQQQKEPVIKESPMSHPEQGEQQVFQT